MGLSTGTQDFVLHGNIQVSILQMNCFKFDPIWCWKRDPILDNRGDHILALFGNLCVDYEFCIRASVSCFSVLIWNLA